MKKVRKNGYSRLKIIHILFCAIWMGGGVSLVLLLLLGFNTTEINGMLKAVQLIDLGVIVPSALGSLLTGILFSVMTNWGFTKHRWIIVKYIINFVPLVLGGIVLAPQLIGMMEIAQAEGINALSNPLFLQHRTIFTTIAVLQLILMVYAVFISVVKPSFKGLVRS